MTFTIHASKNGQSVVTVRISPAVAVDKARVLEAWAGKFTLPIQLGTSSILRISIGFHLLLTKQPNRLSAPVRRVAQCEGFTRRPLEKQISTPTHRKAAILLPTE